MKKHYLILTILLILAWAAVSCAAMPQRRQRRQGPPGDRQALAGATLPAARIPTHTAPIHTVTPTAETNLPTITLTATIPPNIPPTTQSMLRPALILSSAEHLGWKNQWCSNCHELPVQGHTTSVVWECAACHGANGACAPLSTRGPRSHSPSDNCNECHQNQHGMQASAACIACHYAEQGTEPCLDGAPGASPTPLTTSVASTSLLPASALQSSCLSDFPEQPISPSSRTRTTTELVAGQPAVDFTLKDIDGVPHSLSGLLQEKAVLLVLGGYT